MPSRPASAFIVVLPARRRSMIACTCSVVMTIRDIAGSRSTWTERPGGVASNGRNGPRRLTRQQVRLRLRPGRARRRTAFPLCEKLALTLGERREIFEPRLHDD